MHLKWISIVTLALAVSACSTAAKPPPLPQAATEKILEASPPVPAAAPAPSVQAPPFDPQPVQPARIADTLQEDTVRPAEKDIDAPGDVAANPEGSIYFLPGRSEVDESGKDVLRRYAEQLKSTPGQVVTLIGHADALGSRSYSLALAEERMDSVYRILRSLGVPRWQIRRVNSGRGTMSPSCRSISCQRRALGVELVFAH